MFIDNSNIFEQSCRKTFSVNERVYFDIDGTPELQGTGVVLGESWSCIIKVYIVMLDKPIPGYSNLAITIPNTLMYKMN